MNEYFSVVERNSCPPKEEVANGRYEFQDFDFIPPICQQNFLHIFEHPEDHSSCSFFLRRLPRRVAVSPLGDTDGVQSVECLYGWGLEIKEGVNMNMWKLQVLMLFVSVMSCVISTVSYDWAVVIHIGNVYSIGYPIWVAMSWALTVFALYDLWKFKSYSLLSSLSCSLLNFVYLMASTTVKGSLYLRSRLEILSVIIMQELVAGPLRGSREGIQILRGEEYNIVNWVKTAVEDLTGESWDWWPFLPSFQPLQSDESRIQWYCVRESDSMQLRTQS